MNISLCFSFSFVLFVIGFRAARLLTIQRSWEFRSVSLPTMVRPSRTTQFQLMQLQSNYKFSDETEEPHGMEINFNMFGSLAWPVSRVDCDGFQRSHKGFHWLDGRGWNRSNALTPSSQQTTQSSGNDIANLPLAFWHYFQLDSREVRLSLSLSFGFRFCLFRWPHNSGYCEFPFIRRSYQNQYFLQPATGGKNAIQS